MTKTGPAMSVSSFNQKDIHQQPWICHSNKIQKNVPGSCDLYESFEEITGSYLLLGTITYPLPLGTFESMMFLFPFGGIVVSSLSRALERIIPVNKWLKINPRL